MALFIACLASLIALAGSIGYIINIIKGEVSPTKSSWLIFTTATTINISSFFAAKLDLVSGLYITADFLNCLLVVSTLLIFSRSRIVFKTFEKYYLLGVIACILFWLLTSSPFGTNLLVQTLIGIGYIPTIHNILLEKKSYESRLCWFIWTIGSLVSLYPPVANKNTLAIIYSVRSSIMCFALFLLTWRFGKK